ncbi:uncharacterized protein LOC123559688 isoform X2 [Mercenaria mercenaria]|uniref:uncharacterized protein LOC123559688 isoform X2 n=1 Tax=Mercenaria mercenaria TaxID=6596 RepID=UPI00234ED0A6|nr:uncharacterized protein LOC123559688 isoform X2 [Mercenaria mercenaria]
MSDIPEERTYYLRIILMCMDLTKETILKVFRYLIKSDDIVNFLASVDTISKLQDLFKKNILNRTEYNLVYYRPNLEKFDIALLIRLIFGLCKNEIAKPQLGWTTKLHSKDESLGADLIRLRDVRNKLIGHRADAKLSKAEYENIRDKVQAILIRVIENVDPSSKEDVERRIDEYTKMVVDAENTRVKRYLDQLLEYKNEYDKLQDKAEEEGKRSREFQVYFEKTPERYVGYIKLLFDGGRLVLCGILERELDNHEDSLVSLISNNRKILESMVDSQYKSHLFPLEPGKMDHTKWDVGLLATLILHVFPNISLDESSKIELIKTSRLCYAENALRSLDADEFLSVLTDLISSLNFLSMNIAEGKKLEVWSLIERYKKKNDDGDADEYLEQLRKSGMLVKTLKDIHQETVVRLKQLLRKLDETGINFKAEHDLEIKILTTCQNEEMKKNAEDFLKTNLQASLYESDHPTNLIRAETNKLVASINTHPDVKPAGVKRSCILLSFKSSSPSGLIDILDYCASHHFKARLHNISNELHYLFEDTFLLQGHVTLESLSAVTKNVDSEGSGSGGTDVDKAEDIYSTEKEWKNQKLGANMKEFENSRTICTHETEKSTCEQEEDSTFLPDSEGSNSGGIGAEEKERAGDKYSSEKERENQKLDAKGKAAEHPTAICTDETEKSTREQEEDLTLLPDSEGSGSSGIDAEEADKVGDIHSSIKERNNQYLDAHGEAAELPPTICTDEREESISELEKDLTLHSEGSGSGGNYAEKAEDRHSTEKEWGNQKLDANRKSSEHSPTIWTDELEESTSGHEEDSTFHLGSQHHIRALYDYNARTEDDLSFKKGDILILLDKGDEDRNEDWWFARHTDPNYQNSKSEGYVPRNYVAIEDAIKQEWFFGKVTRKETERNLLSKGNEVGTYLIRESETYPGSYVLSIRDYDQNKGDCVKHYKMENMDDGGVFLGCPFKSIMELVEHYKGSVDVLCQKLKCPCPRAALVMSDLCREEKDAWEMPTESLQLMNRLGAGQFDEVWKGSQHHIRALYDYNARTEDDLSFKKGDILILLDKGDEENEDWWFARHTDPNYQNSKSEGYVPRNYVAIEDAIKQEWFFGKVTRKETERNLLSKGNEVGTYLVRESETYPGSYVLSIRDYDQNKGDCVKHYKMENMDDGGVFLRRPFKSIMELVEHYKGSADELCRKLKCPCPRAAPVMSDLSREKKMHGKCQQNLYS